MFFKCPLRTKVISTARCAGLGGFAMFALYRAWIRRLKRSGQKV
jgi:hypothetical protein